MEANGVSEDPRLTRNLNHKQRQILIELSKEYTESKSSVDLKEKLSAALDSITPSPPEGTKVQEINKLRNGGIVVQLSTKKLQRGYVIQSMKLCSLIN